MNLKIPQEGSFFRKKKILENQNYLKITFIYLTKSVSENQYLKFVMQPIVLTFQVFLSFIKIITEKHVIMKKCDSEKGAKKITNYCFQVSSLLPVFSI